MTFGMSTACFFLKKHTEDAIDQIGRMGIKNIEVFFSAQSEYRPAFVKELKKRADDYGISVYSTHALNTQFEPQMFSLHDRQRSEAYDVYQSVLEADAILGAKVYVFHGPTNIKIARKLNINYAYTGKMVSMAAEKAKAYGVKLAYETVHWCWYAHPDFPKLLEPHLSTDNLFYTLDLKQAAQSFHPIKEYIYNMGSRLANVHICDYINDPEQGVVPVLPFSGELDFDELKTELRKIGYDEGMILEVYKHNYKDYDDLKNNFYRIKAFFE